MEQNIILVVIGILAFLAGILFFVLKPKKSSKLRISAPDAHQNIENDTQTPRVETLEPEVEIIHFPKVKLTEQTDVPSVKIHDSPKPSEKEEEPSLHKALSKTEDSFLGRIKRALSSGDSSKIIDEIEEILYTSDLGPKTVEKLLATVRDKLSKADLLDISKIKAALKMEITGILEPLHLEQATKTKVLDVVKVAESGPTVIMILGVNGAGKTTSIGKITAQLAQSGKKVLVAAGDTFRAAAGGQLKVWTERAQTASTNDQGAVEIFWPDQVTDPAAVAFDAVAKGKAQNFDYVILDTAGRLHTQNHLMEELKKVKRVMSKVIPEAPHNTWIVLDANSGQNALSQAIEFNKAMELTGVVLTKLDGTAKGGVVIGLVDNLGIPVKLVGLGEKIGDLKVFNYSEYMSSILGDDASGNYFMRHNH
jgi:fused signal recognition particle receptor